jgi:3-methylcrotonyl-CoA carboxylase alpha subunit
VTLFRRLLIANRGEIACRVIRTAKRLGIVTIAVHSVADRGALHVAMADEALEIGPAPARESYLDIARIIAAARQSHADAVHPGYGFLSENADFAIACAAHGIVFVGPPPAAMRAMGDKAHAKSVMAAAGVPVLSGYNGEAQDDPRFAAEAQRLGYPVLVKAAAGGGGRGMRIVERAEDLGSALASARRESASAFGDDRLILERYLARPRHIEVQIFADTHGGVAHMFERDCSLQRRHQKIIEEAPAVAIAAGLKEKLCATAVAAARAAGYVGAGTVEFLVEGAEFFFIEMNARLQVEHPVTEMIIGLDLVEWQLRIAAGEPLPLPQEKIARHGHAIEARLYAEDPARGFLPQGGMLRHFGMPRADAELRVETGARAGDTVGVHYDGLIAKLVAHGNDRTAAVARLAEALAGTRVAGVVTNRDYLIRVVREPEFLAGGFDTSFLARHGGDLHPPECASFAALAAAACAVAAGDDAAAGIVAAHGPDPHSPWAARDGWRLTGNEARDVRLLDGESERLVRLGRNRGRFSVEIEGKTAIIDFAGDITGDIELDLDGTRFSATVTRQKDEITVILPDETRRLVVRDALAPSAEARALSGRLAAPMPGKILAVHVAPGTKVARGQLLLVLEAMKMEHAITAPADGVVEAVNYSAGDVVAEGTLLIAFVAG